MNFSVFLLELRFCIFVDKEGWVGFKAAAGSSLLAALTLQAEGAKRSRIASTLRDKTKSLLHARSRCETDALGFQRFATIFLHRRPGAALGEEPSSLVTPRARLLRVDSEVDS